jgi:hypothetical protein
MIPIKSARAIMASRQEPDDSLDYFPTPPFATRALFEHVLPAIGVRKFGDAWEPACGEGHVAEVLAEYCSPVLATDVFDYGYGAVFDFINGDVGNYRRRDWIVTNPPFGDKALQFVLRALVLVNCGVAMFFRWQWLETIGRYENLFRPYPPVVVALFVERVKLCKGRWEPTGSTATAYCWIVWMPCRVAREPTRFFWIPPGCRERLLRPDDIERFTAHPVVKAIHDGEATSGLASPEPAPAVPPAAGAGSLIDLEIPAFLRRMA